MPLSIEIPDKILKKVNEQIGEEDIERFLLECLDVGLSAVNQASLGMDFSVVEKGFDDFSVELNRRLMGDESDLAKSIRDHFTNADSPFRLALDPSNENGPVGRFVKHQESTQDKINENYDQIQKDLIKEVQDQFNAIKLAMDYEGIMKRKQDELDAKDKVGTAKGTDFEMEIISFISSKVSNNDNVQGTGTKSETGTTRKVGDVGISINPDNSDPFDITLEVKAGKFTMDGKESLLLQLNDAMEIRKAKAGIAVADIEYAGKTHNDVVRRVGRNRYVVLVDRKNQDFAPVEAMYWALREAVVLEKKVETGLITSEDIQTQVQGIANEISILRALRKNITDATNNILAERDKLTTMESNIKWRLNELKNLGKGGDSPEEIASDDEKDTVDLDVVISSEDSDAGDRHIPKKSLEAVVD
jgi:hypothetical protein